MKWLARFKNKTISKYATNAYKVLTIILTNNFSLSFISNYQQNTFYSKVNMQFQMLLIDKINFVTANKTNNCHLNRAVVYYIILFLSHKLQLCQVILYKFHCLHRLLRGMQRLPEPDTAPHQGKQATMASNCS